MSNIKLGNFSVRRGPDNSWFQLLDSERVVETMYTPIKVWGDNGENIEAWMRDVAQERQESMLEIRERLAELECEMAEAELTSFNIDVALSTLPTLPTLPTTQRKSTWAIMIEQRRYIENL